MNSRPTRGPFRGLAVLALVAGVALSGCQKRSHLPDGSSGLKPEVTDIGSLRIPDKVLEQHGLKNEWVRQSPDGRVKAAYVVGDDLFVDAWPNPPSHPEPRLICYKRQDGLHRWIKNIQQPLNSAPVIYRYPGGPEAKPTEVIFSQGDKVICAEHESGGLTLWEFTPRYSVSSGVAASDSHIYLGSYNNRIYSHQKGESFDDWQYITQGEVGATPTVDGLNVFVTSRDGWAFKFHATKGPEYDEFARGGRFQTGAAITASPVVHAGQVYIASNDFKLYCLFETQFSENWAFQAEAPIEKTPVVADFPLKRGVTTVVLCEARDDRKREEHTILWAVNAANGTRLWKYLNVQDIVAVSKKAIYVTLTESAKRGRVLVSLDPNTGQENFALPIENFDIVPSSAGTSPASRSPQRSLIYLIHSPTGFIQAIGEGY